MVPPHAKVPSGAPARLRANSRAPSGPWPVGGIPPPSTLHPSVIILPMKTKAIFYHAGCPVCVAAEQNVAAALDPLRYEIESVHLGQAKARVAEAERAGVKSVPALLLDGAAYHINFGAGLDVLK